MDLTTRPRHDRSNIPTSRSGPRQALRFALWAALPAAILAGATIAQDAPPPDQGASAASTPMEPTKPEMLTPDASAFSVRSPYADLPRAAKFVQKVALNLVLGLDYAEEGAGAEFTGPLMNSMDSKMFFGKRSPGRRRLLLGLSPSPSGGYDIFVGGWDLTSGKKPNPDLGQLKDNLAAMVDTERGGAKNGDMSTLGQEVYQLSYTTSDRIIANLKTLGYTTIEFEGANAENLADRIFKPIDSGERAKLPLVVKLIDSMKTSLMDAPPTGAAGAAGGGGAGFGGAGAGGGAGGGTPSATTDLGGTYLHSTTAGDPQQRLMIVYDTRQPEALERLVNLIHEKLDVPARQVVIDAQVIEINDGWTTNVGIEWFGGTGKLSGSLDQASSGGQDQLAIGYGSALSDVVANFSVKIKALESSGEASALSSPSVLVLDGRQARIQVGKQVPLTSSFQTTTSSLTSTTYIPVGIVLNIRPRVGEDGRYITMQVETIVSDTVSGTTVGSAPSLNNRQVQSFVRVADNTPFIIGGLMSDNSQEQRYGIPFLQRVPILGWFFRNGFYTGSKREVIIVITPHVVPIPSEPTFSYLLPKASDIFNNFGSVLFRNAYRVRGTDIFDLKFVTSSEELARFVATIRKRAELYPEMRRKEPYASILNGYIPGEDILVKRQLWEIIGKIKYLQGVQMDKILFFEDDAKDGSVKPQRLLARAGKLPSGSNALALNYEASPKPSPDHPFVQPKAIAVPTNVAEEEYGQKLNELNKRAADGAPRQWGLLVADGKIGKNNPMEQLRDVLVLKQLLAVNPTLSLSIKDFRAGRQLIIPEREDLTQRFHIVDTDTARMFYEVTQVYQAFDREFTYQRKRITKLMDEQWPESGPDQK